MITLIILLILLYVTLCSAYFIKMSMWIPFLLVLLAVGLFLFVTQRM